MAHQELRRPPRGAEKRSRPGATRRGRRSPASDEDQASPASDRDRPAPGTGSASVRSRRSRRPATRHASRSWPSPAGPASSAVRSLSGETRGGTRVRAGTREGVVSVTASAGTSGAMEMSIAGGVAPGDAFAGSSGQVGAGIDCCVFAVMLLAGVPVVPRPVLAVRPAGITPRRVRDGRGRSPTVVIADGEPGRRRPSGHCPPVQREQHRRDQDEQNHDHEHRCETVDHHQTLPLRPCLSLQQPVLTTVPGPVRVVRSHSRSAVPVAGEASFGALGWARPTGLQRHARRPPNEGPDE